MFSDVKNSIKSCPCSVDEIYYRIVQVSVAVVVEKEERKKTNAIERLIVKIDEQDK